MKFKTIIIAMFSSVMLALPVYAEYVFISDGSIIQGSIVADTAVSITIVTKENKSKIIRRSSIKRILYTELYMGKIFVNKIDGTVIEVYMVDEDQDSFTFRKELYKPEEFVLKREEVLFTTRTNPVGLKGKADSDSISIDWKAPYTPVKHYRVYIKSGKEYKLYSEPWGKSETLRGLKSNTDYKIKVTALDNEGVESMPSNEIKVTTPNLPPDPPEKIKVTKKADKNKKFSVILAWDNAKDADGKIRSYKIYQKGGKEFFNTNKTEFEVKNLEPDRIYTFQISAIDDNNEESDMSSKVRVKTYDNFAYNMSVQPNYIIPLGTFKKVHKYGAGALLYGNKENALFDDLDLGLAFGYWQFKGADSDSSDVNYSMMIPLAVTAGYRINLFASLNVVPHIALGASFNYMSYKTEPELYAGYGLEKVKKTKWSIEPLVMAGLTLEYDITHRIFVTAGGDAGMLIEMSGIIPFASATVGAGMRF
jgi:hypothetical protein